MVLLVLLIAGVGVVLLIIETAFLRPNLALLPSEEYESGKDVSLQRNIVRRASFSGSCKASATSNS